MTVAEIQQKTKFVQTPQGKVAEVILPYRVYQELLELKAGIDEALQAEEHDCTPNEETRRAIYEAEQGVDLVVCEHAEDLFKKLEI